MSASVCIETNKLETVLRMMLNLKLFLKIAAIFTLAISNIHYLFASDDWVYDLRYKEFIVEANKGNGAAMYELGVMTERGHGTEKNIDEAITWYGKAIKHDNASAYVRLGKLYLEGVSIGKNYEKAFKNFQKAKDNKSYGAYYYLAVMYEKGLGLTKNLLLAKTNYDKAAKWGHYGAQEKSKKIAVLLNNDKRKQQKINAQKKRLELSQYEETVAAEVRRKNQTKINTNKVVSKKTKKSLVAINDIKKSLLKGMWFNGNSPLGYLPSPKTYCISKNKLGLRCVSKEILRNTGREKIYYLIESTISDINQSGDFIITYKNKVTKVDVLNPVSASGEEYVSRVKVGSQKKEHILKCNVTGKNVSCNKDGMVNYVFVNLTKKKTGKHVFVQAFE